MKTKASELVGIEFPIFAFSHCRDVVAAVTNAGGCGVLGAVGAQPASSSTSTCAGSRTRSESKPYGVDLLVPEKFVGSEEGGFDREPRSTSLLPDEHQAFVDDILARHDIPPLTDDGRWSRRRRHARRPEEHGAAARRVLRAPTRLVASRPRPAAWRTSSSVPREAGIPVAALAGSVEHARRHADGRRRTSSSPRATKPAATPASSPPWCSCRRSSTPSAPLPVLAAGGIAIGSPARRRHGARRRRRVVRIGVAHHRRGRDARRWSRRSSSARRPATPSAVRSMTGKPARACCAARGPTSGSAPTAPGRCRCRIQPLLVGPAMARISRVGRQQPGAEQLATYFVGQVVGIDEHRAAQPASGARHGRGVHRHGAAIVGPARGDLTGRNGVDSVTIVTDHLASGRISR